MVAQGPVLWRGLNRAVQPALLSDGESPDTTDAGNYNKLIGALGARKGRSIVYTHTAATTILGLGKLTVPLGHFRFIASSDGKWSMKGLAWPGFATPADVADLTGMNASARVRGVQYKDRFYPFNGTNLMRACDGNVFTKAGIARIDASTAANGFNPTNLTPTATLGGTGLTGNYRYFVTPCNSKKLNAAGRALEGLPSNISAAVTPANQTPTITNIPTTHPDSQVDSFNVYRNKSGVYDSNIPNVEQDFFLVGSVALGTGTFADKVSDDTLTGRPRLRFNQNVPASFQFGVVYNNRLYGAGFAPIFAGTVTSNKAPVSVTVAGNVVTVTTGTAHGFFPGESVIIANVNAPNDFINGTWTIVATPSKTTFTFALVHANTGPNALASGNIVSNTFALDFAGVSLDDGVLGAWFQAAGSSVKYRIIGVPSSTQILVAPVLPPGSPATAATNPNIFYNADGVVLAAASYTIFRNPWEIYITEFGDLEAAGPDGEGLRYKIDVPGNQTPTGMIVFQDVLLVFTANSIYAIYGNGQTIDDIGIRKIYSGIGAVSADTIIAVDNEVHFLSQRGPAVIAGGEPQLYGLPLNTDWLDSLTADELALATMGSDDTFVYVSVPVHGQVQNSKTFRYERYTQSWWEETEVCPVLYARDDLAGGTLNALVYAQDRLVCRPNTGALDLVAAALSGTVSGQVDATHLNLGGTAASIANVTSNFVTMFAPGHGLIVGDSVTVDVSQAFYNGTFIVTGIASDALGTPDPNGSWFRYALTHADHGDSIVGSVVKTSLALPTAGTGLAQCYARFYSAAGALLVTLRVVSNTATQIAYSADATLPGNYGNTLGSAILGARFEIGNVGWKWETKQFDGGDPAEYKTSRKLFAVLHQKDDAATLIKNDIVDGSEMSDLLIDECKLLVCPFETNRANYTYGARLASRNGATLRALLVENTEA